LLISQWLIAAQQPHPLQGTAAAKDLKTYTVRNYAALFSSP
jgi:hypothetical protein